MVLKFKTNINCGNCVRSVSGFINEVKDIKSWVVDTDNPEKILTVEGEGLEADIVIEAVEDAGFDIEVLPSKTCHVSKNMTGLSTAVYAITPS